MTNLGDLPPQSVTSLLEALNCGAFLGDPSGHILHANKRICEMLGREPDELIGHSVASLYEADKLPAQRLINFNEPHEEEFRISTSDGRRIPVVISGRPLDRQPPFSNYRLVTIIDISGQKKAEARLTDEYQTIAKLSDTVIKQALDLKHYSEGLENKVQERTTELHEANMDAIYMLAVASEAKDADTGAHVLRIRHTTQTLALEMGLPRATAERYGYSAILHDVGKMVVPDEILKKPGRLTTAERITIQEHAVAGERILSKKSFFDVARQIARSHHENWDGSGYPDGKKGAEIPQAARIVRLADVYDALISPRVYKPAWTPNDAAEAIEQGDGKLFDPETVAVFKVLFERGALTAQPS
ncbi:MAG: HD domain-containing protein [Phycisphaerales bacterium]|nr:HD domain-containing protein [Phycisphaerales bacterium]